MINNIFLKLSRALTILIKGVNSYSGAYPLLIRAIRDDQLDFAEQIINLGADVNLKAHSNRTALMFLSECETGLHAIHKTKDEKKIHKEQIKKITNMLCDKGADPHVIDEHGNTAFTFAAGYQANTVFWELYSREKNMLNLEQHAAILEAAYEHKNSYITNELLNGKEQIKIMDDEGKSITYFMKNIELKKIIEEQYLNSKIKNINKSKSTIKI